MLVVQHDGDGPPALFGGWLAEAGCDLDVRRPYAGDELPALASYDGLLVLGGAMGANDDDKHRVARPGQGADPRGARRSSSRRSASASATSWWRPRSAAASRSNPRGQQVGLLDVGWTDAAADDPLARPAGHPAARGAVERRRRRRAAARCDAAGRTPDGEVQAVRFAPTVWGVQLHPEVDETRAAAWAESDRGSARDARHRHRRGCCATSTQRAPSWTRPGGRWPRASPALAQEHAAR